MLSARRVSLRLAFQPCAARVTLATRFFSERNGGPTKNASQSQQIQAGSAPESSNTTGSEPVAGADTPSKAAGKPSLVEQLFPEEAKRWEEQPKASREVPRLPMGQPQPPTKRVQRPIEYQLDGDVAPLRTPKEQKTDEILRAEMTAEAPGTGVLVLRNASKNLTEEDFRRLIPQGKHIDGWKLQDADILKVVPGRDMSTLEQLDFYYISFTSQLRAHTYQWHVTRIHKLAAIHTPASSMSPLPPPPGYMIEGLDAHAAIQAYSLVPPSQKLELPHLQRPFTPVVQSIVKLGGYKSFVLREGKMPFEARLTMEGPQLQSNVLRHIFLETGKHRNLSWSGGDKFHMQITKWEPRTSSPAIDDDAFAKSNRESDVAGKNVPKQLQRRTPNHVFVVGFHTESAAQTFIAHWHKRPLWSPGLKPQVVEEDSPPIAQVEMLW